ncbi:hypothetical protein HanRHA438_Chr15g0718371 [Helianthus annuus]|nr:hypothetical protein HanIR_Chr15g0768081 [Helianthus annuus]KAJ0845856.1 hypothetical protein HanRHA438_Chr15g0718371 [Helianthus annuus]
MPYFFKKLKVLEPRVCTTRDGSKGKTEATLTGPRGGCAGPSRTSPA